MALNDTLSIDIARRGTIHIPAKQADHGYDIICTILRNGENIVDASTDTATFRAGKPDNTIYYGDATVNSDNTVTIHVDDEGQMLAVPGFVVVDVTLNDGNGVVKSTQNFVLDVQAAPGGEAIPSWSVFVELEELVESVQQFNNDAEAYATGERGGVPVEEGDPAYHNNAAYYNAQAQEASTGSVRYDTAQSLTDAQKRQAIANIGIYDDVQQIVKVTSSATTMGQIATILNSVNTAGDHVFFDVSALGAQMCLCTIFVDTADNKFKIFDLVKGRAIEGVYDATTLLVQNIALASDVATQAQIDALQQEIDELGGKSVVENWDALADKTADGTSTDVVKIGDIIDVNWLRSAIGTTTGNHTVACSNLNLFAEGVGEAEAKDYLFVYDGSSWTYEGTAISLADFGLTVSGTPATGEVMTVRTTIEAIPHTFVDYDNPDVEGAGTTVPHSWMLERTYAPETKTFDTYEALFAVYQGKRVPAGNYHLRNYCYRSSFNIDMYLTIPQDLGSDDYIVQAGSNGYTSGKEITNADGVTRTGVSVISGLTPTIYGTRSAASGSVSIAYAPASGVSYAELEGLNADPSDPVVYVNSSEFDKCVYGNNLWPDSNLSEWINDEDPAKSSVTPTHMLDIPSTWNLNAGYLYGIDPRVKRHLLPFNAKFVSGYGNPDYTQGQTYSTRQKVTLLSAKEMSFNIQTSEGEATDLYSGYCNGVLTNDAVAARAKFNKAGGTANSLRWSRSAFSTNAGFSRLVTSTGSYTSNSAYYSYYFAPAFIFGKSTNQ